MKAKLREVVVRTLTHCASVYLNRHNPKVVAITGSVGKTSTKDALVAALATEYEVRGSQKSFNSELGIPLTILDLPNAWNSTLGWGKVLAGAIAKAYFSKSAPDWLVLEAGADRPNDLKNLKSWLKTDVIVFTQFAKTPVHVANYPGGREQVLEEKLALFDSLKEDGKVIANIDDEEFYTAIKTRAWNHKITSYGFSAEADVVLENPQFARDESQVTGMRFIVRVGEEGFAVNLAGVLGVPQQYPVAASFAFGSIAGLELARVRSAMETRHFEPGRMRLISGLKETTLIDDSYNSSPIALERALEVLAEMPSAGKKYVILGEMLELGEKTEEEHQRLGELAGKVADFIVYVGESFEAVKTGTSVHAFPKDKLVSAEEGQEAANVIEPLLRAGDMVLIKGSQGIRLEKAVEELMAEPTKARELLARQSVEWRRREVDSV